MRLNKDCILFSILNCEFICFCGTKKMKNQQPKNSTQEILFAKLSNNTLAFLTTFKIT